MVRPVILAVALVGLVAALAVFGGDGRAQPRTASSQASFPILLNPDICAALAASRASGASRTHEAFACFFPTGQGGAAPPVTYNGAAAQNLLIIAATSLANGQHEEFNTIDSLAPPLYECADISPVAQPQHFEADDLAELLCQLDGRDGAIDNKFRVLPKDFAGLDLDGDQMSEQDGQLTVITFVNDEGPVQFDSSNATFSGSGAMQYICTVQDEDCSPDGVPGDGAVVALLQNAIASTPLRRGASTVEVTQESITYPKPYLVTGESNTVTFTTLESAVQDGAALTVNVNKFVAAGGSVLPVNRFQDLVVRNTIVINPGGLNEETATIAGLSVAGTVRTIDLVSPLTLNHHNSELVIDPNAPPTENCTLPGDSAGFLAALARPRKTIVLARVLDDDGTQLTGAFVEWLSDEPDRAVFATNITPTLDLGSFGYGAPNILCGTKKTGSVKLTGNLLTFNGEIPVVGVGFNPGALNLSDTVTATFDVVGEPASVSLSATPPSIPCDGAASSEVSATVLDAGAHAALEGVEVTFSVEALGTASPIVVKVGAGGVAKSVITPLSNSTRGVTVNVSVAGGVASSIFIACSEGAAAGGAAPGGAAGAGASAPAGAIRGPDTGSGPLGAGSAGPLSWWPALGLVAAAILLLGVRFGLKRG